ncbi:hypothetical protein Tco_1503765 [Tanacetum coccineum]
MMHDVGRAALAEGSITFKFIYQPLTPRVSVDWDFWFRQRMSSIDTYSTTKDLVFDETSYKSDEMVIKVGVVASSVR